MSNFKYGDSASALRDRVDIYINNFTIPQKADLERLWSVEKFPSKLQLIFSGNRQKGLIFIPQIKSFLVTFLCSGGLN